MIKTPIYRRKTIRALLLHTMAQQGAGYARLLVTVMVLIGLTISATWADGKPTQLEQLIEETLATLKESSVYAVDDEHITNSVLAGVLLSVDPYAEVLSPVDYKNIQSLVLEQGPVHLGVRLKQRLKHWMIIDIEIDSFADKGGLKIGDELLAINSHKINYKNVHELDAMINAHEVTTLDILRQGEAKRFKITNNYLQRQRVQFTPVAQANDTVVVVKIPYFSETTPRQIKRYFSALPKEQQYQMRGIIVDLRHNFGGLFDAAVETADIFLTEGDIVHVLGQVPKAPKSNVQGDASSQKKQSPQKNNSIPTYEKHYTAQAKDDILVPLIVLVDNETASAAEVFTAAMQDNQRAKVYGQQTFGKGSIQEVRQMSAGYAIKLTTAFYYSPNKRKIDKVGIYPNVVIADLNKATLSDDALYTYLARQF